jgi:hypothetical protein
VDGVVVAFLRLGGCGRISITSKRLTDKKNSLSIAHELKTLVDRSRSGDNCGDWRNPSISAEVSSPDNHTTDGDLPDSRSHTNRK